MHYYLTIEAVVEGDPGKDEVLYAAAKRVAQETLGPWLLTAVAEKGGQIHKVRIGLERISTGTKPHHLGDPLDAAILDRQLKAPLKRHLAQPKPAEWIADELKKKANHYKGSAFCGAVGKTLIVEDVERVTCRRCLSAYYKGKEE